MTLDYSIEGKILIVMRDNVNDLQEEFDTTDPITNFQYAWDMTLLKVDESSHSLQSDKLSVDIYFGISLKFVMMICHWYGWGSRTRAILYHHPNFERSIEKLMCLILQRSFPSVSSQAHI